MAGNVFCLAAGAAALLFDLPGAYLTTGTGTLGDEVRAWLQFVVIASVVAAPFDFVALAGRKKTSSEAAEEATRAVVRGIMLFVIALGGVGVILLLIGRSLGDLPALLAMVLLVVLLSLFQYPVFAAAARTKITSDTLVFALAGGKDVYECEVRKSSLGLDDFTGGLCGLFRFRKLVLPASDFENEEAVMPQRKARYWLDEAGKGYRMGALFLAGSSVMVIALVVLLLPGTGFQFAAQLATYSLWTTVICSGLAALLFGRYRKLVALGFLQRRRGRPWAPMQFAEDIPAVSLEQRSAHPGPPRTFATSWPAGYRLAHFLSWGILNLASRLHPLVAGHPALWVLPPDDRTRYLPSRVTEEHHLRPGADA